MDGFSGVGWTCVSWDLAQAVKFQSVKLAMSVPLADGTEGVPFDRVIRQDLCRPRRARSFMDQLMHWCQLHELEGPFLHSSCTMVSFPLT